VAELSAAPIAAGPADPSDWAEAAAAEASLAGAPAGGAEPSAPPPAAALPREAVEGAVRTIHHALWTALQRPPVSPIPAEDLAAIVDGIMPWAASSRLLAAVLRALGRADPSRGLPRWYAVETAAHREVLPSPLGDGTRAPDGWWPRIVAWARARGGSRRAMGPVDGERGA
jgi:hypothetical protein